MDDDELWSAELHRSFVAAIFEIGMKHSSPSVILEQMGAATASGHGINSERVKSHLQKFRLNRSKGKDEFMTAYDSWMKLALVFSDQEKHPAGSAIAGVSPSSLRELLNPKKPFGSGDLGAFLTYSVMMEEKQKSGDIHNQFPFLDQLLSGDGTSDSGFLDFLAKKSLPFPQLTEAEKKTPLGKIMAHLMMLFIALKEHIEYKRGEMSEKVAATNTRLEEGDLPNSGESPQSVQNSLSSTQQHPHSTLQAAASQDAATQPSSELAPLDPSMANLLTVAEAAAAAPHSYTPTPTGDQHSGTKRLYRASSQAHHHHREEQEYMHSENQCDFRSDRHKRSRLEPNERRYGNEEQQPVRHGFQMSDQQQNQLVAAVHLSTLIQPAARGPPAQVQWPEPPGGPQLMNRDIQPLAHRQSGIMGSYREASSLLHPSNPPYYQEHGNRQPEGHHHHQHQHHQQWSEANGGEGLRRRQEWEHGEQSTFTDAQNGSNFTEYE